jgi:hypothetical protein
VYSAYGGGHSCLGNHSLYRGARSFFPRADCKVALRACDKRLRMNQYQNTCRVRSAQDTCLQSGFLTKDEQKQNDNVSICQKRARAPRDLPARYRNLHLQRPTVWTQKIVRQNSIMGRSYGLHRIFLPAFLILDFVQYGHILGKTLCSGPRRRHGRQAHGGTALAPRHHLRCP